MGNGKNPSPPKVPFASPLPRGRRAGGGVLWLRQNTIKITKLIWHTAISL